jgi:hypothetical protein
MCIPIYQLAAYSAWKGVLKRLARDRTALIDPDREPDLTRRVRRGADSELVPRRPRGSIARTAACGSRCQGLDRCRRHEHKTHAAAPFVDLTHRRLLQRRNGSADLVEALDVAVDRMALRRRDGLIRQMIAEVSAAGRVQCVVYWLLGLHL